MELHVYRHFKLDFLLKKLFFIIGVTVFCGIFLQMTVVHAYADNYFITLNTPNYVLGQQVTVSWTTEEYIPGLSFNPSCQLTITNQDTGGNFTTYSSQLNGSYTFTPTGPNRYLANIYCSGNPQAVAYCSAGGYVWLPRGPYGCSSVPPGWPPSYVYEDGSAWNMGANVGPSPTPTPSPTPYVVLTATPSTIPFDSTSKLTWYGGYITSCTGPATLNPSGVTSGTAITPQLTTTTTYTITCKSPYGTVSAQTTVTVGAAPTQTPTPTITPTARLTTTLTPTPPTGVVCGGSDCPGGGTTASSTGSSTSSTGTTGTTTGGGGYGGSTGGIFIDTNGSKCENGAIIDNDPTLITLDLSDSQNTYNKSQQSTGSFSFTDIPLSSNDTYFLSATNLPTGYTLDGATGSDGSVTFQSGSAQFTVQGEVAVSLCISKTNAWFQTDTGDVRMGTVNDPVPEKTYASTDKNYPSIFFSNVGVSLFGAGQSSQKGWDINNELSRNSGLSTLGSTSYDFYISHVKEMNTPVIDLSDQSKVRGCLNSFSCSLTDLPTGVYQFGGIQGGTNNITLTHLSIQKGTHVTILVNGNLTIDFDTNTGMDIPVGTGGLLIVAAKGNLKISSSTGTTSLTSSTPNLVGIFSAEGTITLQSQSSCPSTSDNKLILQGSLIANSLNPFTADGKGLFINQRSLCINDQTYPVLSITQRPDFLLQLTDFYKSSTKELREVTP